MTTLTIEKAIQNLDTYIIEKRLVIGEWRGKRDGREVGCLLHALGGDHDIQRSSDCPASVMPAWLSKWVPEAFDTVGVDNMYEVAALFRATLESAREFGPKDWGAVARELGARLVEQGLNETRAASVKCACWSFVEATCIEIVKAVRSGDGKCMLKAATDAGVAWDMAMEEADEVPSEKGARIVEEAVMVAWRVATNAEEWFVEAAAGAVEVAVLRMVDEEAEEAAVQVCVEQFRLLRDVVGEVAQVVMSD